MNEKIPSSDLPAKSAISTQQTQAGDTNESLTSEASQAPITKADEANANPMGAAIGRLLHRVRDLQICASVFLDEADRLRQRRLDDLSNETRAVRAQLDSHSTYTTGLGIKRILNISRRLEREKSSDVSGALRLSLFLGLFSAFESFTGDLLRAIYAKKPELFNAVGRTVAVADILQHSSFEELKIAVLEQEIEVFRRKSYIEQFDSLETLFGLNLKDFARWPDFVEASQRRNLYTHCDGIISDQYLEACTTAGATLPPDAKKGQRLKLSEEQLKSTCELLMEVGLKLGQTLWRKLFPTEIEVADNHLNECVYDTLASERWERATVFGEFAVGQKKTANDVSKKIAVINYAIALKFSGAPDRSKEVLRGVDWSSAALDFKLAEAVLEDRFEDASALMMRIGHRGDYVTEHYYHSWPLFKEFRLQPEFRTAYEAVYGIPFVERLQETVKEAQLQVQEQQDSSLNLHQLEAGSTITEEPGTPEIITFPSPGPSNEAPETP